MDLNSIKKTDLGALIAGGLAFILSLFGAYISVSYEGAEDIPGYSDGGGITNAWVDYATFGMLLIVAATAIIAVKVFAGQVLPSGVPWNLIAAAAAGFGTLLIILRALTASESYEGFGVEVSSGPGWSAWPLFIAAIALTVFAALGFKESGEQLPWNQAGTGGSAHLGAQQHGGWQQSGPSGAPTPGAHSAPGAPGAPQAPYGGAPAGQPMAPPPGGAPMPPHQQQQPPPGAPPPPPPMGGTPPQQPPPGSW